MNKNKHNFGCGMFFIILFTFSIFFVTFVVVRNQIKEHFIYGEIIEGIVLEKEGYWSSSTKGINTHYWKFSIKPLNKHKKNILEVYDSSEKPVVNNSKMGDTLTIKIQTEKQAKIISIKGEKINDTISYFWIFIIPIIFFLGIFPYYLLSKHKEKQRLLIIKILILNMLLAFIIAYFFTS